MHCLSTYMLKVETCCNTTKRRCEKMTVGLLLLELTYINAAREL